MSEGEAESEAETDTVTETKIESEAESRTSKISWLRLMPPTEWFVKYFFLQAPLFSKMLTGRNAILNLLRGGNAVRVSNSVLGNAFGRGNAVHYCFSSFLIWEA